MIAALVEIGVCATPILGALTLCLRALKRDTGRVF